MPDKNNTPKTPLEVFASLPDVRERLRIAGLQLALAASLSSLVTTPAYHQYRLHSSIDNE